MLPRATRCLLVPITLAAAGCGSHRSGVVSGPVDTHCVGVAPPAIAPCVSDGASKAGLARQMVSDYGATMYNSSGSDDDCKYGVSWSADNVQRNENVNFTVKAKILATGQPLAADAEPRIEAELGTSHPAPNSGQQVSSPSAGTFHIGPMRFDVPGRWTVRFHFYENCKDVDSAAGSSPHGHAAFFVDVP